IEACENIRPDLLLLGHCSLIQTTTLQTIRSSMPGIHIAHWNCDGLFIPRNLKRLEDLLPHVDATFVTTAVEETLRALAAAGGRVTFMPNPVDSSIESLRLFEKTCAENDVVFVTGARQITRDKEELCRCIKTTAPDLKFDVHGLFGNGGVYGAKFFDTL